jgi:hypothetical protein
MSDHFLGPFLPLRKRVFDMQKKALVRVQSMVMYIKHHSECKKPTSARCCREGLVIPGRKPAKHCKLQDLRVLDRYPSHDATQ